MTHARSYLLDELIYHNKFLEHGFFKFKTLRNLNFNKYFCFFFFGFSFPK